MPNIALRLVREVFITPKTTHFFLILSIIYINHSFYFLVHSKIKICGLSSMKEHVEEAMKERELETLLH